MNWIELHDDKSDGEIFINVEHIESIYMEEPVAGRFVTAVDVGDGSRYFVKETYKEVKDKISYKIWIVSYYNNREEPVVTAFDNYKNAYKYYIYETNNNHDKVCIDECKVHSAFHRIMNKE